MLSGRSYLIHWTKSCYWQTNHHIPPTMYRRRRQKCWHRSPHVTLSFPISYSWHVFELWFSVEAQNWLLPRTISIRFVALQLTLNGQISSIHDFPGALKTYQSKHSGTWYRYFRWLSCYSSIKIPNNTNLWSNPDAISLLYISSCRYKRNTAVSQPLLLPLNHIQLFLHLYLHSWADIIMKLKTLNSKPRRWWW